MVSSTSYNWKRFSLNRTKKDDDDDDDDRTSKVQIQISNTITDTYTVDSQRIV